jgi:Sulfotransferase family
VPVAAPTQRDALWYSPLFVFAPARSHSTVINAMIGNHPRMYAFPELALFRNVSVAEILVDPAGWRGPVAEHRLAGLLRALAQANDGAQTEETIERALRWLEARGSWRGEDVYDHLLSRVAPRIGVEKSPEDSGRDEYLGRVAAAYPRARFLHVTRHPLTSTTSMHLAWKDSSYWNLTPETFNSFCVGVWYHQHLRIDRFVSALPPDRALRVRAEDVLNDPRETLPRICAWLGIDSSSEAVDAMCHPEGSPHARLGPRGALGGGDGDFMRDPVPHAVALPASLDVPAEWAVDPWLLMTAIELAGRFGYEHRPSADAHQSAAGAAAASISSARSASVGNSA